MIKPIRDFVAINKSEQVKQTASGLYVPATVDEKIITGDIMAVGSGLISHNGSVVPLVVKVGDKVAFNKNMAVEVKSEDKDYLLLREEHILCVL